MYRHCTFCASDLGRNQVIEAFPVGRRLAFDPARGRLWVICRACERWNLTPLEERWEAVESCERLYRETPRRVATEQIGLARHGEGLELVRIGSPLRPEFAAWRYGDQFGRRRRKSLGYTVVGVGVAGGLAVGSAGVVGGIAALQLAAHGLQLGQFLQWSSAGLGGTRVVGPGGESLRLSHGEIMMAKVRPGPGRGDQALPGGGRAPGGADPADGDAPWHLEIPRSSGSLVLSGPEAVRALRAILPRVNQAGAGRRSVKDAVRELEEAGGPEAYFARSEARARKMGWGYNPISRQPGPIRLALEMAAHEDAERIALEGELAWLEEAWREAEEVAAIADELTLPDRVREHLSWLKARQGRRRPGEGRQGKGRPGEEVESAGGV